MTGGGSLLREFSTLLQDANVDPLIRQQVLGHQPCSPDSGALGMTSVYTHSRPETVSGIVCGGAGRPLGGLIGASFSGFVFQSSRIE